MRRSICLSGLFLLASCASPEQPVAETAVEAAGAAVAESTFVVVQSAGELGEAASTFELTRSDVDKMRAVYSKGKRVVQVALDSGKSVPCTRLECKYPLELTSKDGNVRLSGTFVLTRALLDDMAKGMDQAKSDPKHAPVSVGGAFACLSDQCKPDLKADGKR